MDLLKAIAALVAWLSGSLAAIAGMLYAFGFLATLSNMDLLGLDPLMLSFEPSFYLERGSRFSLYVVRLLFNILLDPLVVVAVLTALGLVVHRILRERRFVQQIEAVAGRLSGTVATWRGLLYALLLLVLLLQMLPTYVNLTRPLEISGLLFEPMGTNAAGYDKETRVVRDALLSEDKEPSATGLLTTKFLFSVVFFLESALIFYFAWSLTGRWRYRVLLTTPFALVFAMFLISLPMIYGKIVLPNKYSTVRVAVSNAQARGGGEYFLLNKTSDALVLWDDSKTRTLWLPLKDVETVEIGRPRALPLAGNRNGNRNRRQG